MSGWLPCLLGFFYISLAICLGYFAGRYREQLSLLEILKPER